MTFSHRYFENVWIQFKKWRSLQSRYQLVGEHVTLSLGTDEGGLHLSAVQVGIQLYCLHCGELPF
ncbi:hypothetical protein H6G00_00450 [Leptolyngbya sp. FACHB-541]|uniref:hypothetical protein n=1 Tax=Leptolyngbya sp. FACHB-541 TaxID=2692810 RepID=UPI001682BDCA|nr:hypothetical protein [Leptolyngbya sp. FACHB-541]MBD1995098.1 hypothetical protein [Leptolyngbya sp. FACHB-541]